MFKWRNGSSVGIARGRDCVFVRFMVEQDIQDGQFIALLEDQIQIKEQKIHAVYYQQNYVPKRIRLFIDFVAEKLKAYL